VTQRISRFFFGDFLGICGYRALLSARCSWARGCAVPDMDRGSTLAFSHTLSLARAFSLSLSRLLAHWLSLARTLACCLSLSLSLSLARSLARLLARSLSLSLSLYLSHSLSLLSISHSLSRSLACSLACSLALHVYCVLVVWAWTYEYGLNQMYVGGVFTGNRPPVFPLRRGTLPPMYHERGLNSS